MTPPPIPEEAVERAGRSLGALGWSMSEGGFEGIDDAGRTDLAKALQASGALFLTVEEKRALLRFAPPGKTVKWMPPTWEHFLSARQKLEESLKE